ncbi:hypothetical protein BJY04DRAFT_189632 [Aspergillus karnatakaensis]|uniref:uncharacterized protein n=1 Tax=Aspergillus karnatakaensis TaxID=1810916 RepID=UPI003CCE3647
MAILVLFLLHFLHLLLLLLGEFGVGVRSGVVVVRVVAVVVWLWPVSHLRSRVGILFWLGFGAEAETHFGCLFAALLGLWLCMTGGGLV